MFGIFWNNKQENNNNNNYNNNNEVISSSPPNNYDIESASYLHEKNKIEKKIQIEQTNNLNDESNKHDLKEELESELQTIEIKNTGSLNKSVFPNVPPIRIIKSSNLARPYSSSANSSPINISKIIKQNQTITHSLSTNNLDTLDNIHNDSVLIKVELDDEDLDNKKENTELKLYNETLEKINKLKEEDNLNEDEDKDDEENFNVNTEVFADYILKDSVRPYNDNSYYCQFLWSGIEHLDHWELQRKLNRDHAKTILSQMKKDYKKKNQFIFYDVIHLGIKSDGNYYVIDGQHRLVAYYNLYLKNLYPIQKVPAVIWETSSDDDFLEIYERINKRVPFDVTPFNKKILDIIFQMENHFGNSNTIWGKKRPKIDKTLFISEMDTNDSVHKLDADTIMKKIIDINIKIRGLPRSKRTDIKIQNSTHASAESIDFFLGYDKNLAWIHEISI
jgi:hypothetical protein